MAKNKFKNKFIGIARKFGRKSQITMFILIGLLLVAGIGIYFYVSTQLEKKEVAPGVKISVEKIPTELQPVANFVESCIKSVGVNALRRIGQTGGFYEIVNQNPANPTESSSVELSQGSGLNVAYWYHLKDSNRCSETCMFSLSKPKLHKSHGQPSIEDELGRYVNEHLNECLADFQAFSGKGMKITPLGSISADAYISDGSAAFVVDYPLKVETEGVEKTVNQFYSEVPTKLKKMYELADYITSIQASNSFIEKDVLNLMTGFSRVDPDKLPPRAEFVFGTTSKVRWRKSEVKQNIMDMLASYISLLQVYGTRNYNEIVVYDNELGNALYNEGMLIPSDRPFSELEAGFDYLGWQPYFDLSPCKGELCEPESMPFQLLQVFGMHNYNFVYDMSFPVLVSITDPDALAETGYTFQFMLEGNIRGNEPMSANYSSFDVAEPEESLFCDAGKRNSGIVKINVKSPDDVPLDDVQVAYRCAGQNCLVGETSRGILEARFPICLGGIVALTKENHLGKYEYLSTELGKDEKIDAVMEPLRQRKIVVKKKLVEKVGDSWVATLREEELGPNEEAIVTFTRNDINSEDYATTAILKGSQQGDISLYTGEYDIDAVVIAKEKLVIPQDDRTAGGVLGIGEKHYTIPEVSFNETEPFLSGGLKMSYQFTKDDLDNNVIVLYAVGIDLKGVPETERKIEDLEEMGKIQEYSESYAGALSPGFE